MRESKPEHTHQTMEEENENETDANADEVDYIYEQYCKVEQEVLEEWQNIRLTLEKMGLGHVVRLLKIDKNDPRKLAK